MSEIEKSTLKTLQNADIKQKELLDLEKKIIAESNEIWVAWTAVWKLIWE